MLPAGKWQWHELLPDFYTKNKKKRKKKKKKRPTYTQSE